MGKIPRMWCSQLYLLGLLPYNDRPTGGLNTSQVKKHLTPRGNIIFHISKSPHVFTLPLCLWHHRHAQRSTCSKQALGRKPGFLGARLKRHLLRLGGVRGETKRVVEVTWWIYYIVSCCIISWYYTILYYTIRCYTILHYTISVYVIYCIIFYIIVILL